MRRILSVFLINLVFFAFNPIKIFGETNSNVYQWNNNLDLVIHDEPKSVIMLAGGDSHSLALDSNGEVWAWGVNDRGQLGNGSKTNSLEPYRVINHDGIGYLTDVAKIAAGDNFSIALMHDGTLFVWGENGSGVRGTEITGSSAPDLLYPTQVKRSSSAILTNIIEVAGGDDYTLALNNDNQVHSWGWNSNGELGIGCFPSLGQCSRDFIPNSVVQNLNDVESIGAGGSHIIVAKSNGEVWGWGRALEGQLGQATNLSRIATPVQIPGLENVKKVSAENYGSGALTNDGDVYVWGKGIHNPVKIEGLPKIVVLSVGSNYDLALAEDGSVWRWNDDNLQPQKIPGLENINAISAGYGNPSLAASEPLDSTPIPFLDLPWDYSSSGKSFEDIIFNPNSWFDHEYPLQNISCCQQLVKNYTGKEINDYYRSHNGYDYGVNHGVAFGTPVLAAADGIATFVPESQSGGGGNVIKVDHGNGYQTWYEHLQIDGLVVNEVGQSVDVAKGQQIGLVGLTGNVKGPHIHLSVFNDENQNDSFLDDYPFGLIDPLGWDSEENDPWEEKIIGERKGAKSYSLFINRKTPVSQTVANGGIFVDGRLTLTLDDNVWSGPLKITSKNGPFEKLSNLIESIIPTFFLTALDATTNQEVNLFNGPIEIKIDYSDADLTNYKEQTLKIYYFDENSNSWQPLESDLDTNLKIVKATTTHFSQFGLMGELKDTTPPITDIILNESSENNWFNSDVSIELKSTDNPGGLGVEDTLYSLDNGEWIKYSDLINVTGEGSHTISTMSYDKAGNNEEKKTKEFNIDKTVPEVNIELDKKYIWPPNGELFPVKITGSATDENLDKHWVIVTDEYGEISPILTNFGETVYLTASRKGNDLDGRTYTFTAKAQDLAGNIASETGTVVVLHDSSD